jgi:O-succinylbenzoic acid--CoA ligase
VAVVSSLRPVSGSAEEILGLLREWNAADDPEPLVIETSGSTGRAKRVVLSRDAMRASALATQERLGGPGQWVLNLPPTYVAGVQVLYRSVVAGTEPLFEDQVDCLPPGRAYISLVPTQLYRALEDGFDTRDLTRYDAVLVGGGPLSPEVRAEAERCGIRVVQTYGMSETCGGCVYDGRPLADVEIRIGEDDEVLLRGPMLFDGYEDDPERTAAVMKDGWFRTSDVGRLDDDGRLWVTGRLDDVIISGGVKVPGATVADRLKTHPLVDDAVVLGVPDEEWGERVVAFVVHAEGAMAAVMADPERYEQEHRDLFPERGWAPKKYVRIDEVPLLPNGKPDRMKLKGLL